MGLLNVGDIGSHELVEIGAEIRSFFEFLVSLLCLCPRTSELMDFLEDNGDLEWKERNEKTNIKTNAKENRTRVRRKDMFEEIPGRKIPDG